MAKITTSEIFYSPQGEAALTGRPQVWIRVAKCNFECQGFNNPNNVDTTTNEGLGFDPTKYKTLKELPPISVGCDSIYSWDDRFKHMWSTWTLEELAAEVLKYLPNNKWNRNIGLTFTGGEPTSRMKAITKLIQLPEFDDLHTITFETNCSVPLMDSHMEELSNWTLGGGANNQRMIVWSNSPKLSITGEPWEKAIRPDIALQQLKAYNTYQYFKFVVEPTEESFAEVDKAMAEYHAAGIPRTAEIWTMPCGGLLEQQQKIDREVTEMALERGWNVSWRAHIYVFGNEIGT